MKQKIIINYSSDAFKGEIENALYFGWRVIHLAGGEKGWCAILEIKE